MTIAKEQPKTQSMTLDEYLAYDDGTETQRYELWNGQLVDMGAESDINVVIESLLSFVFSQLVPYYCVRRGTEIVVKGNLANTRFPDLVVLTEEGVAALVGKSRSIVTLEMPAPALVVEVVSSSDTDRRSRDRDYINKREEYAHRGIAEYWIVDPLAEVVLVLSFVDGAYQEQKFTAAAQITSKAFPTLSLSAAQVLSGRL